MGWFRDKLVLLKAIFQLIDIEPFALLYIMSNLGCEVTRTQLIQDKLCINTYNQSREYCIDLGKNRANDGLNEHDQIANVILGEVSQYLTWMTIFSYMSNNSSKRNRFIKFSSFELASFIGEYINYSDRSNLTQIYSLIN